MKNLNVAVVGATGVVGKEFVSLLEERDFPVGNLYLFASERSLGESIEFDDEEIDVLVLNEEEINKRNFDIVFFSAGAIIAKEFAPLFQKKGAIVIDNSSAFRMEKDVPLVVPEVNGSILKKIKRGDIIANPNCSTIQMMMFLAILEELYGLKSVFISTYQSVSGAGQKGIDELSSQVSDLFNGKETTPSVFPQRIAFNLVPQIGSFSPEGFTQEETKMIFETRKILDIPDLDIEVTAVRVPVFFSHAETLVVELEREADLEILKSEIEEHEELSLMDDFETLLYPTPADSVGNDEVFIGRLRYGKNGTDKKRINAWIVADNVRKGAALNGIEIAEKIVEVF